MKIAGIDPSMNSTGICIMELDQETFDIKSIAFQGYHMTINRCIEYDNVKITHIGTKYTKLNMFDRQNLAYNIMLKCLNNTTHIAFENYAFGKTHTRSLIQLAEFNGGFKKLLYDMGKGIILYPPKSIKRFATGNGNADKIAMSATFRKEYPNLYPSIFNEMKQDDSPHADLCDAFWIAETLRCHLIYDILGTSNMDAGTVGLLEYKSKKGGDSIIDMELFKKSV
jgi:Holliday junction resolvasome RuvABC endonuclease subunit